MKYSIFLTPLFYSLSLSACPLLVGTYVCDVSSTVRETKIVSQTLDDAVTIYRIGALEIIADRVERAVSDNESLRRGAFSAWCEGDSKLKTRLRGSYFNAGGYLGELTSDSEWVTAPNERLVRSTRGQIRLRDGTLYPFEDEMSCVKSIVLPGI